MKHTTEGKRQRIKRRGHTEIELTREGWIFCVTIGLFEKVIMLTVCRIDLKYVPVLVLLVLWAAFGILTSECMIRTGDMNAVIQSVVRHGFCQVSEWKDVLDMKKAS